MLAGYSHIEQDSRFSGAAGGLLEDAGDGFLFNLHVHEALVGGALEISHQRQLSGDIQLTANLRYNHLYAEAFAASDDVLETSSNFGVVTARAELDGPLGATALGRDLRWISFAANTSFPGRASDSLGFSYFFEVGGGLEIVDRSVARGVEGLSLRLSTLVGDGVTGWSVAAKLEF